MLKLQYEMGHSPINIYTDRPNIYLKQLTEIGCRLFLIGNYKDEIPKEFSKIEYVTPDIKPNIVISQTKLENFHILGNFATQYKAPFIHTESYMSVNKKIKTLRANVNIFSDPYLVSVWEFEEEESLVIYNGVDPNTIKSDKLYYISKSFPVAQMASGICPIVQSTPFVEKYITNGLNGFLFNNETEMNYIINKITKMETEDIKNLGENARKMVLENFPKEKYLTAWQKLLRSLI